MEKGTQLLKQAWGMGYDGRIVGCKRNGEWVFEIADTDEDLNNIFVGESDRFQSNFVCGPKLYLNDTEVVRSGFPKDALGGLGSILYEIRNEMNLKSKSK